MPSYPESSVPQPGQIAKKVEALLVSRSVAELPGHLVLPHYDGYSVANLAPTIGRMLGVPLTGRTPPLPDHLWTDLGEDVRCVVLIVLDAVGYRQLEAYRRAEPSVLDRLAHTGRLVPITSVFPSTTVSALTSIWTGQPPLGHGFLGTTLLLPEQGVVANMLKMAPAAYSGGGRLEAWGWDPEAFVSAPSLAEQLAGAGVRTVMHTRGSFLGSSLTRIFLRGMEELQGYVGLSDLWLNLRRTLVERDTGGRLMVGVYWSGIDNVGHVYGPTGAYVPSALRLFARSFEEDFLSGLSDEAGEDTLLLITADHGQIATPPERVLHLPGHPALQEGLLLPPAGDSRAAYLYLRPGHEDNVRAYVAENLGDRFVLLDTQRALEIGLFGHARDLTARTRVRLGDAVLIPLDRSRLTAREATKDGGSELHGHHGGLTLEEMLVPLLMTRIGAT